MAVDWVVADSPSPNGDVHTLSSGGGEGFRQEAEGEDGDGWLAGWFIYTHTNNKNIYILSRHPIPTAVCITFLRQRPTARHSVRLVRRSTAFPYPHGTWPISRHNQGRETGSRGASSPAFTPRLHILPYTDQLHQLLPLPLSPRPRSLAGCY